MKTMIETIGEILEEGQAVVSATILSKKGSAPRGIGTKMLIKENATIVGTIGGGLLEAMTIQLAAKVFKVKKSLIEKFILSDKDASLEGMVCGGYVEILFEYISPDEPEMAQKYFKAKELRENEEDFVMVTKISDEALITAKDKFFFTKTDFYGEDDKELKDIVCSLRENFNQIKFYLTHEGQKYFIEPIYGLEQLCIVGAGHVSQKIALFAKELGFYTIIIDDRSDFANKERFLTADETHVIPSYKHLPFDGMIHNNSYIVIVTRGHTFDQDVLAQALKTEAKYIGMIGSKGKKKHVFKALLEEGFTKEELERVSCPIGVTINAQTPAEIAISVLAQLIQVKRS